MHPVYYLHGYDSSPNGYRAVFLKKRFPLLQVPQLPNDLGKRVRILEEEITGPSFLIGSSLGGLNALIFAHEHPEWVKGLVLLAPAVDFFNPDYKALQLDLKLESLVIPAGPPTIVIAARKDEVIPLEAVEHLVKKSNEASILEFAKLDDVHLLHGKLSLSTLVRAVETITGLTAQANPPE